MTLQEILDLRPASGDSTSIRAAIVRAELTRRDLGIQVGEAAKVRARGVLNFSEAELAAAAQTSAAASLAFERVDAVLQLLREDLVRAEGTETVAALRTDAARVQQKHDALTAWQQTELPKITAALGVGFALQDVAKAERESFLERVRKAYAVPAVRAAGELGVTLPALPDRMPRDLFPGWR